MVLGASVVLGLRELADMFLNCAPKIEQAFLISIKLLCWRNKNVRKTCGLAFCVISARFSAIDRVIDMKDSKHLRAYMYTLLESFCASSSCSSTRLLNLLSTSLKARMLR
jgi:hypothetical protein